MDIRITREAKAQLEKIQSEGKYLRIMLGRSGCCGYTFELFPDMKRKDDTLLEIDGYGFLVTAQEELLMQSVKEIDYGRKGVFKNFKVVMR